MKKGALGDQPLICRDDAAIFFGMGEISLIPNTLYHQHFDNYSHLIQSCNFQQFPAISGNLLILSALLKYGDLADFSLYGSVTLAIGRVIRYNYQ